MSIALKPYSEMKSAAPVGLEPIPAHWEMARFKRLLQERDSRSYDGREQLLRVSQYTSVTQRQTADGDQGPDTRAESLIGYKRVERSDLVVNIMLAWNGSMGVSNFPGIVSPAYCVYRFKTSAHPRYFHYLLRSIPYKARIKAESTGVVESRLRLYTDDLFRLKAHLPPPSEQAAIARFLDHMDHRIQKYIRAKEKLIALLDEYKQALIHQTVTGQIDVRTGEPYAEYKASGVEWFERLPTHWEMRKLKTVCRIRYGLGQPPPESEWGLPLIRATNVERGRIVEKGLVRVDPDEVPSSRDAVLQEGEIIVVRSGAYTADSAIVPNAFAGSIAGYDMVVTAIKARPDFVASALLSTYVRDEQLIVESMRAAQPHLNAEELGSALVALPPLTEQAVVVTYLKEKTGLIDANVNLMAHQCNVLAEYRARLIADIVTGKLDVRQAAARLPDIDPIGEANASGFTNRIDTLNLDEAATVA